MVAANTTAIYPQATIWTKQDADHFCRVEFSHSGSILALGHGSGNESEFLNSADGSLIRSFSGNHNTTNALLFTIDDQYLINGTGGGGATLTLDEWVVATGTRVVRMGDHNNGTNSLTLTRDGQTLATSGNFDRSVHIYHVPDLSLISSIPNYDANGNLQRVKGVAFTIDGARIVSSDVLAIRVRNVSDGSLIYSIPNSGGTAAAIAVSPDGLYLGGLFPSQNVVRLFRVSDGSQVRTMPISGDVSFPVLAFSANGKILAAGWDTGIDLGVLVFWQTSSGRVLSNENKSGAINSIAFSPNSPTRGAGRVAYTQFEGLVVMAKAPTVFDATPDE